jgi:cell division protein FtsX
MPTIEDRFLLRGGLKAAMVSLNEVPLRRELIVELDNLWTTGELDAKIGDGTTHYVNLPYLRVGGSIGLGSAVTALAIASGVVNINCALGDYFTLALNANVTSLTFSNLPASGTGRTLIVTIT